ncbi:MAG: hypothetical protein WCJ46_01555 [bacterium]
MKKVIYVLVCLFILALVSFSSGCTSKTVTIVDPTPTPVCGIIGGNSLDDDNSYFSNGLLLAVSFTAATNETVTTLSSKFAVNGGITAMGVYTNNAGVPGTLMVETSQTTAIGWNSVTITPLSITSGTAYWLAVYGSNTGPLDTTTITISSKYMAYSYSTGLPVSPTGWSDGSGAVKIYAIGCH